MQTKRCSKCKETKPVSEFGKDRSRKDGLQAYCKACRKEVSRRWYEAYKKGVSERNRRWREVNKKQLRRGEYRYLQDVNNRSLELAHRRYQPWEDWEDEFIMEDNGLTMYQKSVKIGRTYLSVNTRRIYLRKSARAELTNND